MKILCFDIGGTNIKYTLFENDIIGAVKEMPTRVTKKTNYILNDLIQKIKEYKDIDAIGISSAGVIDSKKGRVIFAGPTIPKYTGTKIKEVIEKEFNIPCFVENDVNCAAYGEYKYSKLKGITFCMTIGTGLGGSIIINNKIFSGNNMTAGEIGYMPLKNKTIQDYVSAKYLVKSASKVFKERIGGKELFKRAREGNEIALKVINNFIDNLSIAILNVIYILNPKNIVIGGGITAQGKFLEDMIISKVNEKIVSKQFNTNICLAKLENSAGLYGALYITRKGLK